MRPSTALLLLIIAVSIASTSAGRVKKTSPRWKKGKPPRATEYTHKQSKKKEATKPPKKEKNDDDYDEYSDEEDPNKKDKQSEAKEDKGVKSDENKEEDEDIKEDAGDDDSDGGAVQEDENDYGFLKSEEFKGELREQLKEKGIFYNLESIKEFFRGPDFRRDKEIEDMFQRFNKTRQELEEKIAAKEGRQFPFYVVEGVDPDVRRKVAQILAHRMKGLYIVNQPRVMLGPKLKGEEATKAYYSFAKYSQADKVRLSLLHKPVVTERYWMDHAAFIMAKVWEKAAQLPKPGAEVYQFPEDLLVPNITFALFTTPPPRIGRKVSKTYLFEQRMLLVYKRFTGAKVHIIRFPETPKLIADKIDKYLNHLGLDFKPPTGPFIEVDYDWRPTEKPYVNYSYANIYEK